MQFDQLKRREFITLLGAAVEWPLGRTAIGDAVENLSRARQLCRPRLRVQVDMRGGLSR
jgi:hypothetical protein